VTIVVLSVVGGFIAAPAVVWFGGTIQIDPWWIADTQREAWIATAVGLAALLPALHLLNGIAHLWALFARVMLGRSEPREPAAEAWAPAPGAAPLPAI
jgi:hypothetical protein